MTDRDISTGARITYSTYEPTEMATVGKASNEPRPDVDDDRHGARAKYIEAISRYLAGLDRADL